MVSKKVLVACRKSNSSSCALSPSAFSFLKIQYWRIPCSLWPRYNLLILMPLTPGTRLGPYEITAPLGAGGMGEVYRARDTRLDRTVAIKILPEHLSSNAELKARFEREARAVSSLNHPHICHLYDIGSQNGMSYLGMEYLEGESLADRLRKGALPLKQALEFGIQIAEA